MFDPSSPQSHLNAWLQSSILHLAACLESVGGDDVFTDYGFFESYLAPLRQQFLDCTTLPELHRAYAIALAQTEAKIPSHHPFPLLRLCRAGLTPSHLRALLLMGLVEIDARFGTVYSALHPLPDDSRLSIGLLDDLLQFNNVDRALTAWTVVKDLEMLGLITRHHSDRPRASQLLAVPAPIWDALSGVAITQPAPDLHYHTLDTLNSFEDLTGLLPIDLLDRLARLPDLFERELIGGVILRGMRGTGKLNAMGAIAQSLGYGILHLQRPDPKTLVEHCRLIGALATLQQALPVIDLELAPGETLDLPPLACYQGLFGILLNREGSLNGIQAQKCLSLAFPAPDRQARYQKWTQAINPDINGTREVIQQASDRYHLTLGSIEQASRLTLVYAVLNNHSHIELNDIQEACRALHQQTLDTLATPIETDRCSWDSLIVSQNTRHELEALIDRCRHRETLLAHLGKGFIGTTRGVRALFGGCSGTGKTLAARLIAAELGLDLYRIDLSSVVSKYIGETERNLSRLFARAEEQDIILLLDEGDSLLTARTDVRSSNDRYANLETNYLLQRLEHYEGIFLITSNAPNRIDSAFQRRIDVVIEFGVPDAEQRQRLWQLHLPESHVVSDRILRQAALRCHLTGGQIRNATLHATLCAVEGDRLLCDTVFMEGIHREYHKMGAASPLN
jgi:hypothetical protein